MAITTRSIRFDIRNPDLTPATGDVVLVRDYQLSDSADHLVSGPGLVIRVPFAAAPVTQSVPVNDDPDESPQGWPYLVTVHTTLGDWAPFHIWVPTGDGSTLDFDALILASADPPADPTLYAGINDPRIVGALQKTQNLADVADAPTARTNLGLGNSATRNVGTAAGTVAAGDDSRITGAVQSSTVDAKGDLLVGTADNTVARLAAGTDATYTLRPLASASSGLAWWQTDDLASGASSISRTDVVSTIGLATQVLRLTYFTAPRAETWLSITSTTGGTAAGATPTLCRMGIYSVAGNGDLTLVASCANDTTLWAVTNTLYTRALSSSYAAVAGQRYAAGVLIVTAAALPVLTSSANVPISTPNGRDPRLSARVTGQTDLPNSVSNASLVTGNERTYMEMLTT